MGSILSSMWSLFQADRTYKILILGLNNAGKTSMLYALQLGKFVVTQPTLGGNGEELTYKNLKFMAWDLGGQEQLRDSWRLYYKSTDAIIFVVDAVESGRFPTAKKVLHMLLSEQEEELRDAALLVFANKQDLAGAASPAELIDYLELGKLKNRTWTLMGCSAATGESLRDGMNWIAETLTGRQVDGT